MRGKFQLGEIVAFLQSNVTRMGIITGVTYERSSPEAVYTVLVKELRYRVPESLLHLMGQYSSEEPQVQSISRETHIFAPRKQQCTCQIHALMREGCKCGGT